MIIDSITRIRSGFPFMWEFTTNGRQGEIEYHHSGILDITVSNYWMPDIVVPGSPYELSVEHIRELTSELDVEAQIAFLNLPVQGCEENPATRDERLAKAWGLEALAYLREKPFMPMILDRPFNGV